MEILLRQDGETIPIGDTVTNSIHSVKGNNVRIGIDAPELITVHREEIYNRVQVETGDGGVGAQKFAAGDLAIKKKP